MTICTAWHLQINLYLMMCIHQIFILYILRTVMYNYICHQCRLRMAQYLFLHYYFRTVMFQFTHTTIALEGFSMNNIITTCRVFMENIQDIIVKQCPFKWQGKQKIMSSLFKTQRTFLQMSFHVLFTWERKD